MIKENQSASNHDLFSKPIASKKIHNYQKIKRYMIEKIKQSILVELGFVLLASGFLYSIGIISL